MRSGSLADLNGYKRSKWLGIATSSLTVHNLSKSHNMNLEEYLDETASTHHTVSSWVP